MFCIVWVQGLAVLFDKVWVMLSAPPQLPPIAALLKVHLVQDARRLLLIANDWVLLVSLWESLVKKKKLVFLCLLHPDPHRLLVDLLVEDRSGLLVHFQSVHLAFEHASNFFFEFAICFITLSKGLEIAYFVGELRCCSRRWGYLRSSIDWNRKRWLHQWVPNRSDHIEFDVFDVILLKRLGHEVLVFIPRSNALIIDAFDVFRCRSSLLVWLLLHRKADDAGWLAETSIPAIAGMRRHWFLLLALTSFWILLLIFALF